MNRIQFYPSSKLAAILSSEASNSGVSVSQYVTDLLETFYGLTRKNSPSITVLTAKVMAEVAEYVRKSATSTTFDLLSASPTYRNIPMVNGKKPQATRASIGRSFASKLGSGDFVNVHKYIVNGKQVLSVNNALMYEIV